MASEANISSVRQFRTMMLLILAGLAALFMLPFALVLVAAMSPSLVLWLVDRRRPAYLPITIASANLAGSLYFVDRLWRMGFELDRVTRVLGDPIGWLIVLGAVAVAWIAFMCFPIVVLAIAQLRTTIDLRRMRHHQQHLIEEWGPAVAEQDLEYR